MTDVLGVNKEGILKLFSLKFTERQKFLTLKELITLISKDSGLNISETDIKYCYGMSKMTIVDEKQNFKTYFKVQLAEFMEFLVRLAYSRYMGTTFSL